MFTLIEPKSFHRGRNWFVGTSLAIALLALCTVISLGCASSDGDEPTVDDSVVSTEAPSTQSAKPSPTTPEPDVTPNEPTVEIAATVAPTTQTATPSSPTPEPDDLVAAPIGETTDQDFVALYEVQDPFDNGWIEDSLPLNGTRHWRPAPLGVGVTYLEGVFARVFAIEHKAAPCRIDSSERDPDDECLKVVLQVITDPDPHPKDVHSSHDVNFLIDGEEASTASSGNWYSSDISAAAEGALYTHDVRVKRGWSEAVLIYYPLTFEPIAYFSLTDKDYSDATSPLSGDALTRYRTAANTDQPGLLERLAEIDVDVPGESPEDIYSANPIYLALTCAEYVALPAATPENQVLDMAEEVSKSAAGEAAPEYFANLDDAATFCGTAFPNSSKPLILTMMATSAIGVCYFGDAGAFGADISDVMLSGEKLFAFWSPESPAEISDFQDGDELCQWLLDPENEALKELAGSIDPEVFGGG